jgi:hypothetical protein
LGVCCLTSFVDLPTPAEILERLVGVFAELFFCFHSCTFPDHSPRPLALFTLCPDVISWILAVSDTAVFKVSGKIHSLARRDSSLTQGRF